MSFLKKGTFVPLRRFLDGLIVGSVAHSTF